MIFFQYFDILSFPFVLSFLIFSASLDNLYSQHIFEKQVFKQNQDHHS